MRNYDAVLIRADVANGCTVTDFSQYPYADCMQIRDFTDALKSLGSKEAIFTLIMPSDTDGDWEFLNDQYTITE